MRGTHCLLRRNHGLDTRACILLPLTWCLTCGQSAWLQGTLKLLSLLWSRWRTSGSGTAAWSFLRSTPAHQFLTNQSSTQPQLCPEASSILPCLMPVGALLLYDLNSRYKTFSFVSLLFCLEFFLWLCLFLSVSFYLSLSLSLSLSRFLLLSFPLSHSRSLSPLSHSPSPSQIPFGMCASFQRKLALACLPRVCTSLRWAGKLPGITSARSKYSALQKSANSFSPLTGDPLLKGAALATWLLWTLEPSVDMGRAYCGYMLEQIRLPPFIKHCAGEWLKREMKKTLHLLKSIRLLCKSVCQSNISYSLEKKAKVLQCCTMHALLSTD